MLCLDFDIDTNISYSEFIISKENIFFINSLKIDKIYFKSTKNYGQLGTKI